MNRMLLAIAGLCAAAPAFAQQAGTVVLQSSGPGSITPAVVGTAVNAAMALKADATGGVLTGATLTGGTLAGPTVSGQMTHSGVRVFTGLQSLTTVVPQGSPLATRTSDWMTANDTGATGSYQEFFRGIECQTSTPSPNLGGHICDYVFHRAVAGSAAPFARNTVLYLDGTFPRTTTSAVAHEQDTNNVAGNYGDFGAANSVGMLINGLGYLNTAAISVQTGNSGATPYGQQALWYNGLSFGTNSVSQYTFRDLSSSNTSIKIQGTHAYSVDLADSNVSGLNLRIGNGGPSQGIGSRVGGVDFSMLYSDSVGQTYIGSAGIGNIYSNGNFTPNNNNAYSLGSNTNGWSSIWVASLNNVPVPKVGTPATSSTACVAGQIMFDASYHYDCIATNTWRRVATATW